MSKNFSDMLLGYCLIYLLKVKIISFYAKIFNLIRRAVH